MEKKLHTSTTKEKILRVGKMALCIATLLTANLSHAQTTTKSEPQQEATSSAWERVTIKGVTLTADQYAKYQKKIAIMKKLDPTISDEEATKKVLEIMQTTATITKADQEIAKYDKRIEELKKEREQMLSVIDKLTQSIANNKKSIELDKQEIAKSKVNIAANQAIIDENKKLQRHYADIKEQYLTWDNDMQVDMQRFNVRASQQKCSEVEKNEMSTIIKKWEWRKFPVENDVRLQAALENMTSAWGKQVEWFRAILAQKSSNIAMSSAK
jgi:chromosome segregation ATPase